MRYQLQLWPTYSIKLFMYGLFGGFCRYDCIIVHTAHGLALVKRSRPIIQSASVSLIWIEIIQIWLFTFGPCQINIQSKKKIKCLRKQNIIYCWYKLYPIMPFILGWRWLTIISHTKVKNQFPYMLLPFCCIPFSSTMPSALRRKWVRMQVSENAAKAHLRDCDSLWLTYLS